MTLSLNYVSCRKNILLSNTYLLIPATPTFPPIARREDVTVTETQTTFTHTGAKKPQQRTISRLRFSSRTITITTRVIYSYLLGVMEKLIYSIISL